MTTTTAKFERIDSFFRLRALAEPGPVEGFITLNGPCRSSKTIWYMPAPRRRKPWKILNEIDGTFERMSDTELQNSFLGNAIVKGAFYRHVW